MLTDIRTMVWKECQTVFQHKGSRSRFLIIMLTPVLFATFFAWQWGPDWLYEIPPIFMAIIIPVMLVGVMIPESFAGEKERHTLSTLLASRLPDRAIFLGKLLTPVAVGFGGAILFILLSAVTVNLANWEGRVLFFSPEIGLGSLALSFIAATLTAGAGVLVSMRAKTAQQASQLLMAMLIVPGILLQVIPLLFMDRIDELIEAINGPRTLIAVIAILLAVDLVLMILAAASFRRAKLAWD
jgi:ABC-2 type transport system permease protein